MREGIKDRIQSWYHWLDQQFTNMKRSVKWAVKMYSNQEWDYHYLLDVMEWKLKEMEDHFQGPHSMHIGAETRAKKMLIMRHLLTRIKEDDYSTPWDSWFEEWNQDWFASQTEGKLTIQMSGPVGKKLSRASKRQEELKKADLELFCCMFRKHLFTFWD